MSGRPMRQMAYLREQMPGQRQLVVNLRQAEELCLDYDAHRKELKAVASTVGPALGLAVTRQGTLWINNRTDRVVVYQATVAVEAQGGTFEADSCPVPPWTGWEQKWNNEVTGIVLESLTLVSSASIPDDCR